MKNFFTFEDDGTVEWVGQGGCEVALSVDIQKPTWICSYVNCSRWPYFGRGLGPDDLQMSLPTLTILLFCDMISTSQSKGMSGLVQVVWGTLETWVWISDKVAVKIIRLHSGFWLSKVYKFEAAAGGDTSRMTCQRLYLLRLLLQRRSEGENKNLSKWQLFPFAHIFALEHSVVWSIDLQVNEIRATEKYFLSFKYEIKIMSWMDSKNKKFARSCHEGSKWQKIKVLKFVKSWLFFL